jgi:hypothetical protein
MSEQLRDRIIRLAFEKPELQADLLPLIQEHDRRAAAFQSQYSQMLLDKRGMAKLIRRMRKEDPRLVAPLQNIAEYVLSMITRQEEDALNRINNMISKGDSLPVEDIRNQIGKITTSLGMNSPSIF